MLPCDPGLQQASTKATHHALLLPSLLLQLQLQHSPCGCVAQHAPLSRCAHACLDGCSLWAKERGPSVDGRLLRGTLDCLCRLWNMLPPSDACAAW